MNNTLKKLLTVAVIAIPLSACSNHGWYGQHHDKNLSHKHCQGGDKMTMMEKDMDKMMQDMQEMKTETKGKK